ncbi:hypothetical protein BXY85_1646 [Roseivirga pacifica]|uniref:Uncharacterized protein n=1 Tax=Roseivirga pacifica TaxID=1267423 RepID=A0A1I0MRX8_9BACT|nr:hypothetical protein [Roseivirga pacifica]RKQ50630.1 hypothetical protein BXY85_1646 [Roseivirga pacifica]SEV91095.1 hypothetical protein SAMN05216290_0630 [Roseivirga pacifica]
MDLLEFAVDFSVLFDVLVLIVVLSLLVERALSVIFESSFFIAWYDPEFSQEDQRNKGDNTPSDDRITPPSKPKKKKKGAKEIVAIIVSIILVWNIDFDAIAVLMKDESLSPELGYFITGLIIAGGSKGSIKLFNDVLDFRSDVERRRKEFNTQTH